MTSQADQQNEVYVWLKILGHEAFWPNFKNAKCVAFRNFNTISSEQSLANAEFGIKDQNVRQHLFSEIQTKYIQLTGSHKPPADGKIEFADLTIGKEIGKGNFSVVYKGTWKGLVVAIKHLDHREDVNANKKEVGHLIKARGHPNVIFCYGFCEKSPDNYIVFEYLRRGSLEDIYKKTGKISEADAVHYSRGIVSGISALHSLDIIHRDIACRNIFISDENVPKVADLGLARERTYISNNVDAKFPVRWYAPEALQTIKNGVAQASDVWSFANTFVEMVTGAIPYNDYTGSIFTLAAEIQNNGKSPDMPSFLSQNIKTLLTKCWIVDPNRRITADGLLHELLKGDVEYFAKDSHYTPLVPISYSLNNGTFRGSWGGEGRGAGKFSGPRGIAFDPLGDPDTKKKRIFVSDTNSLVQVFDHETGKFLCEFGGYGSVNGKFQFPRGIAVAVKYQAIYVCDTENHRIQMYDMKCAYLKSFSVPDKPEEFEPWGIAIAASGQVYVTDRKSHRVVVFDSEGVFSFQFGNSGSDNPPFRKPAGIAISPVSQKVYVVDYGHHQIQVFALQGKFLSKFGDFGTGAGNLSHPDGIAIDRFGNVFVADGLNDRINIFDDQGNVVVNSFKSFGVGGNGNGQFDGLKGITVDDSGKLYVCDSYNDRIQVFV